MTTSPKTPTDPGPEPSGPVLAAVPDGLPAMIAYLTRVLKTPTIGACWEQLAAQARDENWSHEEYLGALLQRQVADRAPGHERGPDPHHAEIDRPHKRW